MASGCNQWASLTDESAYGVTQTTAPTTTWLLITDNNGLSVVPQRMTYAIRSTGSRNRKIINVPGRTAVRGKYISWLYSDTGSDAVTFAERILTWATTLDGSVELPSYTLRHFDGVRNNEYLGGKVEQLKISGAPDQAEGCIKLELDMIFQRRNADPATFTDPGGSVYPKAPYRFQESAAGNGLQAYTGATPSTRTIYKNFELTIKNFLYPSFDEHDYISDLTWNGRDIDFSFMSRFRTKADRDAFEAQTSFTAGMLFTKVSPAHTLQLTMNGANYISPMDRSLNLGEPTYETLHFQNFLDTTEDVNEDFSFAAG